MPGSKIKRIKISLITPVLNNQDLISGFLRLIKKQNYPKDRLEILIMDGGSTDRTVEIAKKLGAKVVNNPDVLAEPGVNLGMQIAKGDIFIILAVDNYLNQADFLDNMASVFENDESIVAAFPKQDSDATDTIWSRYANIFTDPFNHFVYGYAANSRTFKRVYRTAEHNKQYDVYDYKSSPIKPMIAFAQCFTVRSGYIREENDNFDDCLPVIKMIRDGKKIAYVYSASVFHHTIRNIGHFIKKQKWATLNAISNKNYGIGHRAEYLSSGQRLRIKIWPLYACSIVFPLVRSLYGLVRDGQPLWLIHPLMCLLSAYSSIWAITAYKFDRNKIISRQ